MTQTRSIKGQIQAPSLEEMRLYIARNVWPSFLATFCPSSIAVVKEFHHRIILRLFFWNFLK